MVGADCDLSQLRRTDAPGMSNWRKRLFVAMADPSDRSVINELQIVTGCEIRPMVARESALAIGYRPPMTVPWGIILVGTGIVMGLSVLASVWPAVSAARSEPLTLLQAGRAAA